MSIAMESDKQVKRSHDCSRHYDLQNVNKFFNCEGCKMNGSGPRFVCNLCDDTLHKVCRYPKPTISHDFFKGAIFIFTETVITGVYKRCSACQKDIRGFSYHCEAKNLDLHPVCYKLEKRIYFDSKIFDLHMKLSSECKGCNKSDNTWSYVSSCKNHNFHVHCFMERVHELDLKRGDDIISYNCSYSATPDHTVRTQVIDMGSVIESRVTHSDGKEFSDDEEMVLDLADGGASIFSTKGKSKLFVRTIKLFVKTLYDYYKKGTVKFAFDLVEKVARTFNVRIENWTEKVMEFITQTLFKLWAAKSQCRQLMS